MSTAPPTLLRQYQPWEATGEGYPDAWNRPSVVTEAGTVLYGRDRSLAMVAVEERMAIKDLIRDATGNRCQRCWHPYLTGDPRISERGEWSPCDNACRHP